MPASEVLTIGAAALVVDATTAAILLRTGWGGRSVRAWYRTYGLGALSMDVLSLVIGTYLALRVAPHAWWAQALAVVLVQLTHDLAFGAFVRSRGAKGPLMDLFRRYADEMGATILGADALMMLGTLAVARVLQQTAASEVRLAIGAVAAYLGLLVVYSF